jgi:hypothetical protein
MTINRRYGEDTSFGRWMRDRKDLESHPLAAAFTANDVDWIFHRYKTHVDAIGTKEVQCLMFVEVKTHMAVPRAAQRETLFFINQRLNYDGELKKLDGTQIVARFFGVHVLCLENDYPEDSAKMCWSSFDKSGNFKWYTIKSVEALVSLLKFDVHPDTFCLNPLRRHHRTKEILVSEKQPLGFYTDRIVIQKS